MKILTHLLNPISIIAIFAALCEASATTVLPYLDNENRQVYLWFLIAFPSALVVMFFLTLNFNNKVLYGPYTQTRKTNVRPEEEAEDITQDEEPPTAKESNHLRGSK